MRAALVLALLIAAPAIAADPKSEDDKTLYAIGLMMSGNLVPLELSESEVKMVVQGIQDGVAKRKPKVTLDEYGPKVQGLAQARGMKFVEAQKARGQAYVDAEAKKKGAKKTTSGAVYQETKAGTGPSPQPTDTVKVHYQGTLTDGTVFDSSLERGEPTEFPLNGVIPCWTEGVAMMKKGGKARLICPSDLAYGDRGMPPNILPASTLVFEVELLDITKK